MVRIALAALIFLSSICGAYALPDSAVPTKIPTPWGSSAGGSFITNPIPVPSQIGITNCAASFTDGFPPLTFQPAAAGGCAPFGKDFNGIFFMLSSWVKWINAGGPLFYDSSFSSSVSGYPKQSVLANLNTAGCFWVSTVDNNASNPDTGGANWTGNCANSGVVVGGTSTGSANAQAVTGSPFILQAGAQVTFIAGFSNSAAMTLVVNGGSAISVVKQIAGGSTATLTGNEVRSGQVTHVVYDGTNWQLLNPTSALFNGLGGTSGGSANAQTITTTPFVLQANSRITFIAGFTNTTAATIAVNGAAPVALNRDAGSGLVALTGGEITSGTIVEAVYTGSVWVVTAGPVAFLTAADQQLSGGANVSPLQNSTGTVNLDCGLRPLQWVNNTGAFTVNAPANASTLDSSCILKIENGVGASASITWTGFTLETNHGDSFTANSGDKFFVFIGCVHNSCTYINHALQ